MRLSPHKAKTEVQTIGPVPRVFFTPKAIRIQEILVDECAEEVGWVGEVEVLVGDDQVDYLVTDIHIPKQEVASSTTEISEEGMAELTAQILESDKANGLKRVNQIKYWGHSHAHGGTSPSGQDETQLQTFIEDVDDFFIRAIANKSGDMKISISVLNAGLIYHDVPWDVWDPEIDSVYDFVEKQIKDNVKKKQWTTVTGTGYQGGGYSGHYEGPYHFQQGSGSTAKRWNQQTREFEVWNPTLGKFVPEPDGFQGARQGTVVASSPTVAPWGKAESKTGEGKRGPKKEGSVNVQSDFDPPQTRKDWVMGVGETGDWDSGD